MRGLMVCFKNNDSRAREGGTEEELQWRIIF